MIVQSVTKEMKKYYDAAYQKGCQNFFKERVKIFGVRTPNARKISSQIFRTIQDTSKREVFANVESLLQTGYLEFHVIAFDWVWRIRRQFAPSDFSLFETWIKKYVTNWASCDGFCTKPLGYFLLTFPQFLPQLKKWARSRNMWVRRAAAVSLIYPVRKGQHLDHVFSLADLLFHDTEDLVQKGYGWMLKEASNVYPKDVFAYVMRHKDTMPRTALRYAIEKYPAAMRKKAMAKSI